MKLLDFKFCYQLLLNRFDLDLNHDEKFLLNAADEELKKYPFRGERRDESLRIRRLVLELHHLIGSLEREKDRSAFASIVVQLKELDITAFIE